MLRTLLVVVTVHIILARLARRLQGYAISSPDGLMFYLPRDDDDRESLVLICAFYIILLFLG